jgi:hypothetical protein
MQALLDARTEKEGQVFWSAEETGASIITLKPAIRYQFKTGQRDWPKT